MRGVDLARFPNIAAALDEVGIDPAREPVPVAPAAHYTMGGVAVDLDGRSSVPGLYAVGESACTGLHGANRLASNSLAECFVFGRRAALAACREPAAELAPVKPGRGAPQPARAIRPAPRSGAVPACAGTRRGCARCWRSPCPWLARSRWPAWPGRRAGAHTSATTSPPSTPRSTACIPW